MAYNVGQVEVTVFPNAQRFNELLGPQLTERAREIGRDMGDQIADRIRERLATIGDVNLGVDTSKASVEIDKFLAETDAKAKIAGDEAGRSLGNNLSNSAAKSGRQMSPLIVAAIAGGLTAGAPLLLGAAGLLFGGIAALALHSNAQVSDAFKGMEAQVKTTFQNAAQVAIPFFVSALGRLGAGVQALGPQFQSAFGALKGPLDSLTTGILGLVSNAMPGLVSAVKASGPVFQGLASFLGSIGTGLGQFFQIISEHAGTARQVFKSLGDIIGALLPILGQLVGAGSDLASVILPPLAGALELVAKALNAIAPVLPVVIAGFIAFKIAGALSGPLNSLATSLTNAGTAGSTFSKVTSGTGSALSAMGRALPIIGVAFAAIGAAAAQNTAEVDKFKQSAESAFQALHAGGPAADMATQKIAALKKAAAAGPDNFLGLGTDLPAALKSAERAATAAYNAMTPLEKKQQDVAAASATLQAVLADPHHTAAQAAAASQALAGKQAILTGFQQQLATATDGAMTAGERHLKVLQGIANAASAATTQTSLLKTALDSLSGKSVDLTTAQIQLQQAIASAATATKGQAGAIVDASGGLNVYTAAGQAAGTALIGIRDKGNQLIATMEQQGASTAAVTEADARLRATFIQTARQMGFTSAQAQDLANKILGIPGSRTTQITADTAQAKAAILGVQTLLSTLHDKTITTRVVTQYDNGSQTVHPGVRATLGAIGGMVHAYAGGGIEPMQGGIAQIVPPNTLRVIGDRVTDDEAYIPINRDLRSQRIWAEAGHRMGLIGAGARGGGSARGTFTGNLYLDSGEFLGKVRGEAESVTAGMFDLRDQRGDYNG